MSVFATWFEHISATILGVGYPGVFVSMVIEGLGIPFPGDAFLTFYGYTVAQGQLNGLAVLSMSTLGYFCGVSIVFLLIKRFGQMILQPMYKLTIIAESRMNQTSDLMSRFSALVLIPGRLLPGIRTLSTYAAALARMPYSTFSFYTIIGSFLWCGVWIGLGYWFGENMHILLQHARTTLFGLSIGIISFALITWMMRRRQGKKI